MRDAAFVLYGDGKDLKAHRAKLGPSGAFFGVVARRLLIQMSASTDDRQAVLTPELVEVLGEFLAFRHLFRGASIALMRWSKLSPLVAKVENTFAQFTKCIEVFRDAFLR
jgi:hypothetical protein